MLLRRRAISPWALNTSRSSSISSSAMSSCCSFSVNAVADTSVLKPTRPSGAAALPVLANPRSWFCASFHQERRTRLFFLLSAGREGFFFCDRRHTRIEMLARVAKVAAYFKERRIRWIITANLRHCRFRFLLRIHQCAFEPCAFPFYLGVCLAKIIAEQHDRARLGICEYRSQVFQVSILRIDDWLYLVRL